ncbi:MAG: 2-amino-4-hydroxy-6-hydroxymethyldihydropteridine diphosphokinase [Armatimonadota bacterium]
MSAVSLRRAYLSLGANLGDRAWYLHEAIIRISALPATCVVAESPVIETPPWGKTNQPAFLNMAIALDTTLTPEELLASVRDIEDALGRRRVEKWGPRTIDIDILVYEGEERDTPMLHLPHPYLTERRFVLEPLAAIAPDLVVHGKTIREWLEKLPEE